MLKLNIKVIKAVKVNKVIKVKVIRAVIKTFA